MSRLQATFSVKIIASALGNAVQLSTRCKFRVHCCQLLEIKLSEDFEPKRPIKVSLMHAMLSAPNSPLKARSRQLT